MGYQVGALRPPQCNRCRTAGCVGCRAVVTKSSVFSLPLFPKAHQGNKMSRKLKDTESVLGQKVGVGVPLRSWAHDLPGAM